MTKEDSTEKKAYYVDEHRNVLEGDEAIQKIQERQNSTQVTDEGVLKVDRERWEEAQRYERRTWMDGQASLSDRNEDHREKFANYALIRGRHFDRAIELGCGPFTNLRFILEESQIDQVDLLDPLMDDYENHQYCRYRGGKLGGVLNTSMIPFSFKGGFKHPIRFLRHKLNEWRIGGVFGKKVNLHPCGIEDYEGVEQFDLVVIINVIEHCRDIDLIFQTIDRILKPGGTFVYSDKIYHASEEAELSRIQFDAGHPIRVDHSVIKKFLDEKFDSQFYSVISSVYQFKNHRRERKYDYFIGTKK
ncbi:methyltransferase [bacterium]|nr:methyltransferase [bacterium]MDB4754137.1 methyltransferase [Akkermansiaceae bacterium]